VGQEPVRRLRSQDAAARERVAAKSIVSRPPRDHRAAEEARDITKAASKPGRSSPFRTSRPMAAAPRRESRNPKSPRICDKTRGSHPERMPPESKRTCNREVNPSTGASPRFHLRPDPSARCFA